MSDMLVNEQLIFFGDVDIPLNNDNTMKLLQSFGDLGFMPNVVQEINLQTGQSLNRMSLTNSIDSTITFNTDRIVLSRAPKLGEPELPGFVDLAVECTQRIAKAFDFKINRCVLSKEKFMAECSEEKMNATKSAFLNSSDNEGENTFEWFVRRSIAFTDKEESLLKVLEVGRLQGNFAINSVLTDFDRIRIKAELGTDFFNRENRYALKDVPALIFNLKKIYDDFFSGLERIHHES